MDNKNDDLDVDLVDALIPEAEAPIPRDSIAYIDTIVVMTRREPRDVDIKRLQASCLRGVVMEPRGDPWPTHWRTTCQQPTRKALEVLDGFVEDLDGSIQEVAIALDVKCESAADVESQFDWFYRHLDKPYGRDATRLYFGSENPEKKEEDEWATERSLYLQRGKKWRGCEVAMYGRQSKIDGQYCLHLELRFRGSYGVKKLKCARPSRLANLDPRPLFRQYIRLASIDYRKLGRQRLGRSKSKTGLVGQFGKVAVDKELRTGHLLARVALYERNSVIEDELKWLPISSMILRQFCKGRSWFSRKTVCPLVSIDSIVRLPTVLTF